MSHVSEKSHQLAPLGQLTVCRGRTVCWVTRGIINSAYDAPESPDEAQSHTTLSGYTLPTLAFGLFAGLLARTDRMLFEQAREAKPHRY